MATDPSTVEFLLDQLGRRGATFTTKRMFGEYCVYRDGQPVAFVCDDVLFVKDTEPGRAAVAQQLPPEFGPPYPCAKPYLRLAPDTWDEGDWLRGVLDATASALPLPKPRSAKGSAATRPAKKAAANSLNAGAPAPRTPPASPPATDRRSGALKPRVPRAKAPR